MVNKLITEWIGTGPGNGMNAWVSYFFDDIRKDSPELSYFRKILVTEPKHTETLILKIRFREYDTVSHPYLRAFRLPGVGTLLSSYGSMTEWSPALNIPTATFSIENLNHIQFEDHYGIKPLIIGGTRIFVAKPLADSLINFVVQGKLAKTFETVLPSLSLHLVSGIYGTKDIFAIKFILNATFGSANNDTGNMYYLVTPFGDKLFPSSFFSPREDRNIFESLNRHLKFGLKEEVNEEAVYNYVAESFLESLTR